MLKIEIDWAEARHHENEFFDTTQPWCSLDSYYQSFLRTSNLTNLLSTILAELIAKRCEAFTLSVFFIVCLVADGICVHRLPKIQNELYQAMQQTEESLRALPKEPSHDPVGEVLRVLGDFQKELSERLEGTPDEDGLLQTIRPHTMVFRREIRSTAPDFVPWERKEDSNDLPEVTFLSSEEEEGDEDDIAPIPIYIEDVMQRALKLVFEPSPHNTL